MNQLIVPVKVDRIRDNNRCRMPLTSVSERISSFYNSTIFQELNIRIILTLKDTFVGYAIKKLIFKNHLIVPVKINKNQIEQS